MQYGHVGKLIEDKKYDPPLSFSMLIYPFVNFTYENKNKLVENSHRPNVTNSLIIGSVVPFISPQHSVYYSVGASLVSPSMLSYDHLNSPDSLD